MKKITAIITAVLLCYTLNAQRFDWVSTGGYASVANGFQGARDIARDSEGNLYIFDSGNGTMHCQGDTIFNISGSPTRTFVYKFNPLGQLIFMKAVGNTIVPYNIELDENDNLYLKVKALDFVSIPDDTTFSVIGQNFYIFKFDKNFNFKSSYFCGSPNNSTKNTLLQYADGSLYTTKNNNTLVKLDTNLVEMTQLNPLFLQNLTAMPLDFTGSSVFSNGDILFAAYSRSNVSYVENDTLFQPENPFLHGSHLLIRADQNLNVVWAKQFNGFRDPDRYFLPVCVGNDNSVFVLGQVSSTLIINNDTVTGAPSSLGSACMYKVSNNGSGVWARVFGDVHQVRPWNILNNPDGSGVFATGFFSGDQQFGPLTPDVSKGRAYIIKMSYSGDYQNIFTFTGTNYEPLSLSTDGMGTFYVGGRCFKNFSPVFSCEARSSDNGFYLAKFYEQPDLAPQPSISVNGNLLTATPEFFGNIQWFLNGDLIANANSLTYTATENGDYSVQFSYEDGCVSEATSTVVPVLISSIPSTTNPNFNFYPNPTNGIINYSGLTNEEIFIYNVLGKNVYQHKPEKGLNGSIDLTNLSEGIYFLKQSNNTYKLLLKK